MLTCRLTLRRDMLHEGLELRVALRALRARRAVSVRVLRALRSVYVPREPEVPGEQGP